MRFEALDVLCSNSKSIQSVGKIIKNAHILHKPKNLRTIQCWEIFGNIIEHSGDIMNRRNVRTDEENIIAERGNSIYP